MWNKKFNEEKKREKSKAVREPSRGEVTRKERRAGGVVEREREREWEREGEREKEKPLADRN